MTHGLKLRYRSALAHHEHNVWLAQPVRRYPVVPEVDESAILDLPIAAFNTALTPLRLGRFYPAQLLLDAKAAATGRVFRVVDLNAGVLRADFNHALASRPVEFQSLDVPTVSEGIGMKEQILSWAGMDSPYNDQLTDFVDEDAFERDDDIDDALFYSHPEFVSHVDGACQSRITSFYTQRLKPDDHILDLMTSWRSYLPESSGRVIGLGMNGEEMRANPKLDDYLVHDLNKSPALPFADGSFDAVVNTVSIDYVVRPLAVLRELKRVLRPGGRILISFSNRFFPSKTILLWKRLHPAERLQWVLQLLHEAGFGNLNGCVERGLRRDKNDKYAGEIEQMDPLFAASGEVE